MTEEFSSIDSSRWLVQDNYSNGGVFNCDWSTSNASLVDGALNLILNDTSGPTKSFSCGEIRTKTSFQYGRFNVRMRPAKNDGIVSSFFIYSSSPHDEIDLEFLGKDTSRVQLNYFKNGVGGNEFIVDLGFDASLAYHDYSIEWEPNSIVWFVDGQEVHRVNGNAGSLPSAPGYVYVNLWNGTGVDSWLNPFVYSGEIRVLYDQISIYQ
jgi:beta-glucanase (GH16 family)